jgi:glycosyltransferase involved in cell wall biosynthesis
MQWPKITVVTPSFNQGQYLEQTILSVVGQEYPALEYFVFDGGSTDNSRDIIRSFEEELAGWRSEPDGGQANAINQAFARSSGEILCWINSDDFLLPGTLRRVARHMKDRLDRPHLIYGKALLFRESSEWGKVQVPPAFDAERLRRIDYIVQPSSFWTRALWELTGALDGSMHFAFDWDWFLRASSHVAFEFVDDLFSAYRFHADHKTSSGKEERWKELIEVIRRYSTSEILEHYLYMYKNRHRWDTISFRMRLYQGFKYCSIPFPDFWADLLVPQLWNIPRHLDRRKIWDLTGLT